MIVITWKEKRMLVLFRGADPKTRRRLHAMAMRMINHHKAGQQDATANDNDRRKPKQQKE